MSLQCGIVGLPNVGKSTIFNALTSAGAAAANYPFCTIEPNVGIVSLPDERLEKISSLFQPEKITPTVVEFLDIAGLVKGASKGEGLGNQFLGHIRSVDAIIHVVRCFEDPDVVHVHGNVDPLRDIEVIETELALADLETVSQRIQKVEKKAKAGDDLSNRLLAFYHQIEESLNKGQAVRNLPLKPEEQDFLKDLCLLTSKPLLYVANVTEEELVAPPASVNTLKEYATKMGTQVILLCGKVEAEISELPPEERTGFLQEMGLKESGLNQLARAAYKLLQLATFFTAGPTEVRAWTIRKGTKAPQAAGVIHSDFEKGFIRAECYAYNDLITYSSEAKVREAGKIRLEGKEYVVQDGDVLFFRFNV